MAKRGAASYLTDQNWDQEDEPEEAGEFKKAESNVLQKREIRKARRRGGVTTGESITAGAFKGFSGFTSTTAAKPFSLGNTGDSIPGFSFGNLSKEKPPAPFSFGDQAPKQKKDNLSNGTCNTNRAKYLQHLKCLNEGVSKWIKQHIDQNPYCILTPIFDDYEKHLKDLEVKYPHTEEKEKKEEETAKPSVTFAGLGDVKTEDNKEKEKPAVATGFKFQLDNDANLKKSPSTPAFKTSEAESTTIKPFSFNSAGTLGNSSGGGFSFATGPVGGATKTEPSTSSNTGAAGTGEEEYVPPKNEVEQVKEDDAFYTKRCKLFYQKEGAWVEKGLGNIHLKPCSGKTQLLIRADTNLGNILLNIMISSSIPASRQGKNNVNLMCIPNPPIDPKIEDKKAVGMLIRVKTAEDADELFEKIKEAKEKCS